MKVREIASALATTPDTVRYYTRLQLITPAKSDNGYKFYSTKDASRLRFILSARHLGFSVEDIKQILREADNGKTACPLHVPAHSDHPFRFNPITDFGLIRSPISELSDQK